MDSVQQFYTTKPVIPPYSQRSIIRTSNPDVSLRPYQIDDLASFHELRSQIEVMRWTSTGTVDADLDTTKTWMERFMESSADLETGDDIKANQDAPPVKNGGLTFGLVILYTPGLEPSEQNDSLESVIGCCGVHSIEPEIECGYMIRQEFWGKGIATAAMKAFVQVWWNIPRQTVQLTRESAREAVAHGAQSAVDEEQKTLYVNETLKALIAETNIGSQKVLAKLGFQFQSRETVQERGEEVSLANYVLHRPGLSR